MDASHIINKLRTDKAAGQLSLAEHLRDLADQLDHNQINVLEFSSSEMMTANGHASSIYLKTATRSNAART